MKNILLALIDSETGEILGVSKLFEKGISPKITEERKKYFEKLHEARKEKILEDLRKELKEVEEKAKKASIDKNIINKIPPINSKE